MEAGKEEAIKPHFLAIKSWLNKRAHHTVYVGVNKPDFELGASPTRNTDHSAIIFKAGRAAVEQ